MSYNHSTNSVTGQRTVVSIGDLAVSENAESKISTFGVGMSLAIVLYDSKKKIGGIAHVMLPDSTLSPEKSGKKPGMFVDTAIPALLKEIENKGGALSNIKVLLAGSAETMTQNDAFKIGKKNVSAAIAILTKSELSDITEDLGGKDNRTLHLTLNSGDVEIKTAIENKTLTLK